MSGPVVFDCDGVLVDSEPIANRTLAEVLTEAGVPMSAEESVARFMGRSWASVEAFAGERVPGLKERYESRMYAAFAAELRPVDGVEEVLDALAATGVATCVASSGSHEKIAFTLGRTGLLPRFEGRIFSASEVASGKPAPDLFLHAAERMGWEARSVSVVEDSPPGVQAGRAAGMRVLGYAGGLAGPEALASAGADVVFTAMEELSGLLVPT